MITTILPKHPMSELLQTALADELSDMYFVGHNARNLIYGFPKTDKVFQFLISQEGSFTGKLLSRLQVIPGYQDAGGLSEVYIKGEAFDVDIRALPVDQYLLRSAYAGDGVALHVPTGRLLVLPEYLTMAPTDPIRDRETPGLPKNPMLEDSQSAYKWNTSHQERLASFEKAVTTLAGNGMLVESSSVNGTR